MEDRRSYRVSLAIVVVCVLVLVGLGAVGAHAEDDPPFDVPATIVVSTGPDAAIIEADAHGKSDASPPAQPSRPKRKCHLEPVTTTGYVGGLGNVELPTPPDEVAYWLKCDDGTETIIWRKKNPTPAPAGTPPLDVAMHLRREIPVPQVSIRVNPSVGLTGTESWFWIEGYSGQTITDSADAFGQQVEVQATVTRYEWSFGDGGVMSSNSLGAAYPQRSEIRHVYERSSAGSAGYQVSLDFVFTVRYRVAGGAWVELPGISRTASFRYTVRESQAVISR